MLHVALEASTDLPRFGLGRLVTQWSLAPLPFVVTIWAGGLYLLGVHVLHRRGDRWPVGRTLAHGIGLAAFYAATS